MIGHRPGMEAFRLDLDGVGAARALAATRADAGHGSSLVDAVRQGAALDDTDLATLFLSGDVSTDTMLALACATRSAGGIRLETFSPLYLTNECDAECRMCGMRRPNTALLRETADAATVAAQLALLHRRGLRAVALLTGEYRHGARRAAMIDRAAAALRTALDLGYRHVLVNIGALDGPEYPRLLDGVARGSDGRLVPRVTMCTFQESYQPVVYRRFMGTRRDNPRADYRRRLENFDRAADAGFRVANPGVLVGLNPDLGWELLAVLAHVRHLERRGMEVYLSVPRLRRATGAPRPAGVDDDTLCRLVAVLSLGAPAAKVVVSTREPVAIQRRLAPVIGVLTPGSPGVAPYTATGARFELAASQFEVLDHRPIEAILGEYLAAGATIDCFEPAGAA